MTTLSPVPGSTLEVLSFIPKLKKRLQQVHWSSTLLMKFFHMMETAVFEETSYQLGSAAW